MKTMNSADKIKFLLFALYSLIFLLITTDYLSLNALIYTANQTDIISYTSIAKEAPSFPNNNNNIIQHIAQRFLIPYIIGSTSNFFNLEIFSYLQNIYIYIYWSFNLFYFFFYL